MNPEHDLPEYEVRILRAIRRIIRAVDMHSKQLQGKQDITTPQLIALISTGKAWRDAGENIKPKPGSQSQHHRGRD
ncbi:hypothetical protein [Paraperlucidibaca baekdonensis]|uniref:hypothetical protein n=1 Tax=Paraperlucidibaca baekdonensis TaxID=748120 RepID=UPI0015F266A8|nr:hypothetical protein [Paraperlucidibaca baekdonensis]